MTSTLDCLGGRELCTRLGCPPNFADATIQQFSITTSLDENYCEISIIIPSFEGTSPIVVELRIESISAVSLQDICPTNIVHSIDFVYETDSVSVTISAIAGLNGSIKAKRVSFLCE